MSREPLQNEPAMDWSVLTSDQREDIEYRIRLALGFITVTGVTARWKGPGQLPHWQLIIETSWCSNKSARTIARACKHAIKMAQLHVPMNGVLLKDFQQ
jgi:hypothetical protein